MPSTIRTATGHVILLCLPLALPTASRASPIITHALSATAPKGSILEGTSSGAEFATLRSSVMEQVPRPTPIAGATRLSHQSPVPK